MKNTIDKTLVGQLAVRYEPYLPVDRTEQTAQVYSITEVGRKYIKAGGFRFDKDTLCCPDSNWRLFIGSPEEFSRTIRTKVRVLLLMDKVRMQLDECLFKELEMLRDVLDGMTTED